jgi:hypothetical protein
MAVEVVKAFLCLSLLVLPILIAWIPGWGNLSHAARIRTTALFIVLLCAAVAFGHRGTLDHRIMPWLGHVIGTLSIVPNTGEMLGTRPVTLGLPWRVALSLLVILSVAMFLEQMVTKPWRTRPRPNQSSEQLRQAVWILGPFAIGYAAFLLPRAIYFFIFDRYLLELLPVAITFLCLTYQRWVRERLPVWCTVMLVVSSLYAVTGTHDWFALNRARVAAIDEIEKTGVPANVIQGGYDYDGWTEIEVAGYINDPRIISPPQAYKPKPNLEPIGLPDACRLDFAPYTPAVQPKYFVVFSLIPCLQRSPYAPVTYRNWLPPFRRTVFIQEAPSVRK